MNGADGWGDVNTRSMTEQFADSFCSKKPSEVLNLTGVRSTGMTGGRQCRPNGTDEKR
jgi:hypothetical protein